LKAAFLSIFRGSKNCDHLPYEWQRIVYEVIGIKKRAEFGTSIFDHLLSEKIKVAIESFQDAIGVFEKEKAA
jgi:hypothetical protein